MSVLARKRIWVPAVVVAVALAGFEGYGAYTRSKPVDYARGGDDFGSTAQATPTPTGAPTTTAAPSATPGATAVPSALPRVDATTTPSAAVPVGPSAAPVSRDRPAGPTVPVVGSYPLAVEGQEKVQFGPVSFCDQTLPSRTNLVVKKAAGESATSYDFDVPFFPGKTGQHDERHIYRFTPTAVYLDYEIATVTCQGVRQSSETSYQPEQAKARLPLRVGASWHYKGGGSNRTEDSTAKVLRTETLTVGGEQVLTYVISTTTSFTGSESGTRDQTWWYAPSWALPVKWHDKQSGHRSGASYSGDITATVLGRP